MEIRNIAVYDMAACDFCAISFCLHQDHDRGSLMSKSHSLRHIAILGLASVVMDINVRRWSKVTNMVRQRDVLIGQCIRDTPWKPLKSFREVSSVVDSSVILFSSPQSMRSMSASLSITVIGGGIGGLTSAIALRRAGHRVKACIQIRARESVDLLIVR